ncbi:CCR4-Not complex 3'-5'-exoribonuclease subunit Ccr4 isoform X2 [Teleopsis dalmanni]|uniref:CCR4-Not complex 3'-5'-exoribonuclease subunit Ccr4 isoform X2 n=1 Tax=Teleopsis dalmanni TaxID=139649 RepID=UPI0018CDDBFB|nr:CCR4-Not complex 3'-5'-exoribonuclease subunit Ccr4 isoform X2 [Teleopsis dalmanni]
MTRLTEEMVIARSKQSDLASIKKLNCWGSDLSDVSIIKKMRGVEVLALSVNKISSLQPFEDCVKLQELYLRKNNIKDLNEIGYLQNLPNLKYLWLEENPCCEKAGPSYRAIILRALPNLKKLDNVEVTEEEVNNALSVGGGSAGSEPGSNQGDETYDDAYENQPHSTQREQYEQHHPQQYPQNTQRQQQYQQQNYHPQSPQSPQQQYQSQHGLQRSSTSPVKDEQMHPPSPTNYNPLAKENRMSYHQFDQSPGSDQSPPLNVYRERSAPIPPSMSTHSMKEYYHSDRPAHPAQYRHSQNDLTEWDDQHSPHNQFGSTAALNNRRSAGPEREPFDRYPYRNGNARENGDWDDVERNRQRRSDGRFSETGSNVSPAVLSHLANYNFRRPIHRNSNLLSATLCLVRELDYPSLEVVEHAVRCRIDELTTQ